MATIDLTQTPVTLSFHVARSDVKGLIEYAMQDPDDQDARLTFRGELTMRPNEDGQSLRVELSVSFQVRT